MSYVHHHISGRWYEFDDRAVTELSPEQVAQQEAYVLMYKRNGDEERIKQQQLLIEVLTHTHTHIHTPTHTFTCTH